MKKNIVGMLLGAVTFVMASFNCYAIEGEIKELGEFSRPFYYVTVDTPEQISDEITEGEMELISQLVEAEAGNQDLTGKRLVVDVILNRLDDGRFGDSIEEIIFTSGQFSVIDNGAFDDAAWNMQDSDYEAVVLEFNKPREERLDSEALYFNSKNYLQGTCKLYKYGDHYFSK